MAHNSPCALGLALGLAKLRPTSRHPRSSAVRHRAASSSSIRLRSLTPWKLGPAFMAENQWKTGWWLTYPSEKWWSSSMGRIIPYIRKIKIVWNHQPENQYALIWIHSKSDSPKKSLSAISSSINSKFNFCMVLMLTSCRAWVGGHGQFQIRSTVRTAGVSEADRLHQFLRFVVLSGATVKPYGEHLIGDNKKGWLLVAISSNWWFQPPWKIWKSDWIIIPTIGENQKCSKPPTSHSSSHHLLWYIAMMTTMMTTVIEMLAMYSIVYIQYHHLWNWNPHFAASITGIITGIITGDQKGMNQLCLLNMFCDSWAV